MTIDWYDETFELAKFASIFREVFHNPDLIQMKDVVCNGVESRLSECNHQNLLNNPLPMRCESSKAVIVKCLPLKKVIDLLLNTILFGTYSSR